MIADFARERSFEKRLQLLTSSEAGIEADGNPSLSIANDTKRTSHRIDLD
jgi:hypothetical protein